MKEYLDLEIELIFFLQEDVVRTSDNVFDGDSTWDNEGDDPYGDF